LIVEKLVYILPAISCLYLIVACWWVGVFFRSSRMSDEPVGIGHDFTPPVSVLKPVKGLDQSAYENFASFCRQSYPEYEVLFAVADPNDEAVPVIERVIEDFQSVAVRMVTSAAAVTASPKVSSLVALTHEASHPVLVVSDSDTRVGPDYLRRVVAPLAYDEIGLVTCAYRGVCPSTFTAKLEALHIGVTFLPQVIVARRFLDMRFALGATVAFRKSDLEASGGWRAIGAYLADDNRLALQLSDAGKRVVLSHHVVDVYLGTTSWREQWHREVRWARTNRLNRPREYAGIILTLTIPLALILIPLDPSGPVGWAVVAAALVVRWTTAWLITSFTDSRPLRRWLPWLPIRDLLSALTWVAGAAGRSVTWRGERYRVRGDGRLEPLRPPLAYETQSPRRDHSSGLSTDEGSDTIAS
jgi:ceramide glucosyltransferase